MIAMMSTSELITVAARVVAAGVLVCLFAVIGELAKPKPVAGIFSAAPSVALASLLVLLLAGRHLELETGLRAMTAGAVAFVAGTAAAAVAIRRTGAAGASVIEIATWLVVGAGAWFVWLR